MKKNRFAILFLVIVGICFYVVNVWIPEFGDDLMYVYMFPASLNDRFRYHIKSLTDIYVSQYNHYYCMNGRVLVHSVVQFFCGLLGKPVFNVFNTLVYCGFIYTLQRYATKSFGSIFFLSVTLFFTALLPSYDQTFLWMTGSINYLWVVLLILVFLMVLEKIQDQPFRRRHIAYLLFGLLVGWTHEGFTVPLAASLVVYAIWNRKTIGRSAALPLIVGFVVGAFICISSPASVERAAFGGHFKSMVYAKLMNGFHLCSLLRFFYLFLILLIFGKRIGYTGSIWQFLKENAVLVGAVLFSFVVIFGTRLKHPRVAFGMEFFSMLLVLRFLHGIKFSERVKKVVAIVALTILVVLMIIFVPYYVTAHSGTLGF